MTQSQIPLADGALPEGFRPDTITVSGVDAAGHRHVVQLQTGDSVFVFSLKTPDSLESGADPAGSMLGITSLRSFPLFVSALVDASMAWAKRFSDGYAPGLVEQVVSSMVMDQLLSALGPKAPPA